MRVIVHPSVPMKSIKDLITLARAKPGALTFMSPGSGTPGHLAGGLFKRMTQIDMLRVPYKGGAAALNNLIAGQIQLSFYNMAPGLPHVRAERLRGIAVTGEKRSPAAPEFPTVIESGVPGFVVMGWWDVFTPKAHPHARLIADAGTPLVRGSGRIFRLSAGPAFPAHWIYVRTTSKQATKERHLRVSGEPRRFESVTAATSALLVSIGPGTALHATPR
jgi:hypothetical protein